MDDLQFMTVWVITGREPTEYQKAQVRAVLQRIALQRHVGQAVVEAENRRDEIAAFQGDVRDLLLELDLGDNARPISAHRVVRDEIIPAIRLLRAYTPYPEGWPRCGECGAPREYSTPREAHP